MQTSQFARRRGTALITVMIVLLIVSMLLLGSLHTFATAVRYQRSADRQLQARWLATSALSRALAQLQRDPNYSGETWNLTSAELFGEALEPIGEANRRAALRATMTVEIESDATGPRVEATAVLSPNSARPVRVAKKLTFHN